MQFQDTGPSCHSVHPSKSGKWDLDRIHRFVKPLLKPVRILQFLVVLLIFAFVTYMTALGSESVSSVTCILLIILSGAFVLVLAIDIISQLSGGELQSIPMFLFSFLGVILFGIAGILLIPVFSATELWYILTILCLCLLLSILFLIDVLTVVVFWKRSCDFCKELYCANRVEVLYQKPVICYPTCDEITKHDLTTSVSSLKVASGDEEVDHSRRKVGYGRRREYVDRQTSAPKVAIVEVADIQTEPSDTRNIQSQTHREIKEIPVQTVSKCELCNRQIPIFSTPKDPMVGTVPQTPCATCPALMQLIRGAPCCPGCRCVTGIIQVPQQTQQQQTQRQKSSKDQKPVKDAKHWQQPVDEKSYEIVTSEQDDAMKGRTGTITKLTLASYCVTPSQMTDTSCQTTVSKDSKATKKAETVVKITEPAVKITEREKKDKKLTEVQIPEKEKKENDSKKLKPVLKESKAESSKKETKAAKVAETEVKITECVRTPAERPTDSVKCVTQEKPVDTVSQETAKESIDGEEKLSMTPTETKQLISPPRLVAEMIDRLQEIEGNKQDLSTASEISRKGTDKTESKVGTSEKKSEVGTSRIVGFAKGPDEIFSDDSRMKSLDSQNDSSNITMDSKLSSYISRESSEAYGYSDKDVLKPVKSGNETEKVERSSDSIVIPKPHMGTQTKPGEAPNPNRQKRTYIFQKKNKVEPAEVTHTETDVQTLSYEAQSEKLFAEKSPALQAVNVCPSCRRLQVLYKDGSEKRLKCAGCKNFIRPKRSYELQDNAGIRNKINGCPNCGKVQEQLVAPILSN
ncbi:uncharacterized protein LOC105663131 isoform X2 [Megachile rotundata]|uniref:uncharacterized protein LOC105663131 isoform X2 n=1 Tax=Megachile rotundata TaxID=143995 RepID=UPI003FD51858